MPTCSTMRSGGSSSLARCARPSSIASTSPISVSSAITGSLLAPAWGESLCQLAAEGKLDRRRLLSASLASLLKNTETRNTTWFTKFHELLEPTVDERQNLQSSYLHL